MNLPKRIDQQLVDKLINFIKYSHKNFSKVMVGINGDLNSLVAAAALQRALGEKAVALIFDFDEAARTNSLTAFCQNLSLNTYILKRGVAYRSELSSYHPHQPEAVRNFYNRFINYHLLIQADNMKAVLVDIIDKSDRLAGTRPQGFYGQIMPFYSLYKTEIIELAKLLNLPEQFIPKTNQWEKVDQILYLLTEKTLKPEEIAEQLHIDLEWIKKINSRINKDYLNSPVNQFII
ncbi:MAG: Uncharacterized protein G01um10147_526 [Microgenomates group bacterium Gr01-1014_7]|nr:MAG: Uncharacterized protein G01um10147_526 [Microgenomates group bacterium Gr01-1014_7]